jgi:GAF domain
MSEATRVRTAVDAFIDCIRREADASGRTLASDIMRACDADREAALAALRGELAGEHADAFVRLTAAVRRIDKAGSLAATLDALARGTTTDAARVALFLVQGDELHSWRHSGFARGSEPVDLVEGEYGGILESAIDRQRIVEVTPADVAADPTSPPFLRMPEEHAGLACPLVVGSQVVALLYADGPQRRTELGEASVWSEQVEVLVRHAALRLENMTSRRTVEVLTRSD